MKPIYISFATPDYREELCELHDSCKKWGLDTDFFFTFPGFGSWVANCAHKPLYIWNHLLDYPDRSVVWLDADARIRQYPALFDSLTCDFAAHWRHGSELLSGTLYFGPTERARALADAWCIEQSKCPDEWDQRVLQRVIERDDVPGLVVERIPATYTRVFDDPKMGEPVIEHLQASRRLAKAV